MRYYGYDYVFWDVLYFLVIYICVLIIYKVLGIKGVVRVYFFIVILRI